MASASDVAEGGKRLVHEQPARRGVVEQQHDVPEEPVAGTRVDDSSAAETAADTPGHFPGFEQFLARQALRAADDSCDAMEERVVRKPAEVVGGEPGLRGRIEHVVGSDLASPGERGDVLAGAERQGGNGLGGLPSRRRDHAAAIADEEVRHVVRAMEAIDHRRLRVVAHAARPQQVNGQRLRQDPFRPGLDCPGRLRDLARPCREELRALQIVRVIVVGDTHARQAPGILQRRID